MSVETQTVPRPRVRFANLALVGSALDAKIGRIAIAVLAAVVAAWALRRLNGPIAHRPKQVANTGIALPRDRGLLAPAQLHSTTDELPRRALPLRILISSGPFLALAFLALLGAALVFPPSSPSLPAVDGELYVFVGDPAVRADLRVEVSLPDQERPEVSTTLGLTSDSAQSAVRWALVLFKDARYDPADRLVPSGAQPTVVATSVPRSPLKGNTPHPAIVIFGAVDLKPAQPQLAVTVTGRAVSNYQQADSLYRVANLPSYGVSALPASIKDDPKLLAIGVPGEWWLPDLITVAVYVAEADDPLTTSSAMIPRFVSPALEDPGRLRWITVEQPVHPRFAFENASEIRVRHLLAGVLLGVAGSALVAFIGRILDGGTRRPPTTDSR